MAIKKKKKAVKKVIHVRHRKKSHARRNKAVQGNEKNQQAAQGTDENDNVHDENKTNYGGGEFGNEGNTLDRGEVIYDNENQDNQGNTVRQEIVDDGKVLEENIQEKSVNTDDIAKDDNVKYEDVNNIISESKSNIAEKNQIDLPPIPKISSKKVVKPIKPAVSQFTGKKLMTEKDIAMDFAIKAHKRFDRLIKASILFGSQTTAKDNAMTGSDIDIIFIIDDAAIDWDLELVSWYREELGKLVVAQSYGMELHINTVRLVTWWEDLMHGDPVVINILRYGEALIDSGGFFNPIKALLLSGKIRSTPEAVYAALQRSPWHIARSKSAQLGAIEGVYWSMIDSAHAALITAGKLPPSPEHVPDMLREVFVDSGMLKMSFVKSVKELYSLHKAISHGNVSSIKGQEIDEWQELAEKFLSEMTRIIDLMLEAKK